MIAVSSALSDLGGSGWSDCPMAAAADRAAKRPARNRPKLRITSMALSLSASHWQSIAGSKNWVSMKSHCEAQLLPRLRAGNVLSLWKDDSCCLQIGGLQTD